VSKVIVVGAGLFGSIIAESLSKDGHDITVIDDKRPMAGSLPSACLMKPGWFAGMGKDKYEPSLALLDECFGIEDFQFKIRPSGVSATVHRVNPLNAVYLNNPAKFLEGQVTHVGPDYVKVISPRRETGVLHFTMEADVIVVAAGIWCRQILLEAASYDIVPKCGVAYRIRGAKCSENRIDVWAPYKQLVGFQERDDQVWIGDGSAIIIPNWKEKRIAQSRKRCQKFGEDLGVLGVRTEIQGYRPYVQGAKPCVFEQVSPKVWLATGGAKNGTIAAGWVASELRRALS